MTDTLTDDDIARLEQIRKQFAKRGTPEGCGPDE